MAEILILVTSILSVVTLSYSLKFFRRRAKPVTLESLAEINTTGEVGLVGLLLPRPFRAVWNALAMGACVFVLGTPHHLVLWNFYQQTRLGPWLYFHYVWTLVYWLALVSLLAAILVGPRIRGTVER